MNYVSTVLRSLLSCVFVMSVLLSCSDEVEVSNSLTVEDGELTDEMIEKVAYGCNSYLDEVSPDEKVETSASDDYMALVAERMTTIGGNKANGAHVEYEYNKYRQYVGVIEVKGEGCGKFRKHNEVIITYDSENRRTKNDRSENFSAWEVSRSGNVVMKFCLVPYESFGRTGEWYGVMNFSENNSKHMLSSSSQGILHAVMDAEDRHDDDTYMRFNNFVEGVGSWTDTKIGNVRVDGNGNLDFQMIVFEPGNDMEQLHSYPDFGFDYGVFGTIRPCKFDDVENRRNIDNCGFVHTDDEDSSNANLIEYNGNPVKNTNFHNIIYMDKNTTMYMTRVKSKLKDNK